MIVVNYMGMMGNNLFQYAFGRIIAEKLGYALRMNPPMGDLKGFPNITTLEGLSFENPEEILDGHLLDLKTVLDNKSNRKIILKGYFQRTEYYLDHKDVIKNWFSTNPSKNIPRVNPNDIVVHIRRGNYGKTGSILDLNFYREVLDPCQHDRVFVCGIGVDDKTRRVLSKYNPIYVSHKPIDDFNFIKSFNKIIQSTSTFCWWASFLSDAKEIYTPRPVTGYWGKDSPIDLKVEDKRYIYINNIVTGVG